MCSLCCLDCQVCPFLWHETPQPYKVITLSSSCRLIVLHRYAMMHHAYKAKWERHMFTGALTNGHHREIRCPFHVIFVGIACAAAASITIKGENAVQCRYVRCYECCCKGKNIHIRARRQVGVDNVEALLLDIVYSF